MSAHRLPSVATILRGLGEEIRAQADRGMLWAPVAFGAGAATYLGLADEPPVWPLAVFALITTAMAVAARRWARNRFVVLAGALLAVFALGLADAKWRSDQIAAPIVPTGLGVTAVEGWVVDVANPSDSGPRLLIAPVRIGGLPIERLPLRIRLVCPKGAPYGPGSPIRVLALVDPPPGPAAPGAFDFARDAWFSGLGAVGLAMKPVELTDLPRPPWRLRLVMALNGLRWSLAERLSDDLRNVMGGEGADGATGLAVTVATGHEDWLGTGDRDDLRYSGLAHMLAIAGLHMAAVSGFVFFAVRLGVAAWPRLALRVSGKKLAAAAGLVAVIAYLALSGAHPPARRAAITASVAFIAILCGRRAISLHSLAIAALVILALQPEVVVQPGFEMSFCATAALVALAEIWPHRERAQGLPWYLALPQGLRDWLIAMVMVSLVAGAATSPFAIQHFNRIATWGLFANLTADLVASLVMMPALALCLALEGLGAPPLLIQPPAFVAAFGARSIVWLAHLFATAPGAARSFASAPDPALLIAYLGLIFVCLWRGRLRWLGLPMACAVALWPRPAPPVAWLAADGADAALAVHGQEIALKPGKRAYAVGLWAQRRGLALPDDPEAALSALYDCDRSACAPHAGVKPALAAWWTVRKPKPERLEAVCRGADILILRAPVELPPDCRAARVLRPEDFAKGGAAEVFANPGGGYRLVWSQPMRGRRPWSISGLGGSPTPSGSGG